MSDVLCGRRKMVLKTLKHSKHAADIAIVSTPPATPSVFRGGLICMGGAMMGPSDGAAEVGSQSSLAMTRLYAGSPGRQPASVGGGGGGGVCPESYAREARFLTGGGGGKGGDSGAKLNLPLPPRARPAELPTLPGILAPDSSPADTSVSGGGGGGVYLESGFDALLPARGKRELAPKRLGIIRARARTPPANDLVFATPLSARQGSRSSCVDIDPVTNGYASGSPASTLFATAAIGDNPTAASLDTITAADRDTVALAPEGKREDPRIGVLRTRARTPVSANDVVFATPLQPHSTRPGSRPSRGSSIDPATPPTYTIETI